MLLASSLKILRVQKTFTFQLKCCCSASPTSSEVIKGVRTPCLKSWKKTSRMTFSLKLRNWFRVWARRSQPESQKEPVSKTQNWASSSSKPSTSTTTTMRRSRLWKEPRLSRKPQRTRRKNKKFKGQSSQDFSSSCNFCANATTTSWNISSGFSPILTALRRITLLMWLTPLLLRSVDSSRLCAKRPAKLSSLSLISSMKWLLFPALRTRSVFARQHSSRIFVTWPTLLMTEK